VLAVPLLKSLAPRRREDGAWFLSASNLAEAADESRHAFNKVVGVAAEQRRNKLDLEGDVADVPIIK